jgi:hypothetical protein
MTSGVGIRRSEPETVAHYPRSPKARSDQRAFSPVGRCETGVRGTGGATNVNSCRGCPENNWLRDIRSMAVEAMNTAVTLTATNTAHTAHLEKWLKADTCDAGSTGPHAHRDPADCLPARVRGTGHGG